MNMTKKIGKIFDVILTVMMWGFLLIVLALIIRVLVCDQFPVPSRSMEPTIIPGDHIVVNKLIFGARIYKNLDFIDGKPLETFRIKGLRKIRKNDILVFNAPLSEEWRDITFNILKVYAKRCIGLPGDTLSIINGFYHNSGTQDTLGYHTAQLKLSAMAKENLQPVILRAFPQDSLYNWDIKDFGPLYVPAKGSRINVNCMNYLPYQRIIEYETHQRLSVQNRVLLLGDTPLTSYIFQENYYFMGGDHVLDSQDSRYFGFVPEEFIIGVVQHILYHRDRDSGAWNWERFLKRI